MQQDSRHIVRSAAILTAIAGLLSGCAPEGSQKTGVVADTGKPALHAVFSDQLKTAMRELDRQASDRIPAEIYSGGTPVLDMSSVAEAAGSMATTAEHIPDALTGVRLSDEDRRVFVSLSEKLRSEALQLRETARQGDLSRVRAAMQRVTVTCNACHTAFRILPAVPKA